MIIWYGNNNIFQNKEIEIKFKIVCIPYLNLDLNLYINKITQSNLLLNFFDMIK